MAQTATQTRWQTLGQRETFSLFGTDHPTPDGTCIRDYIHVSDLAAALRPGISGPYNLGRGRGDSVREVIAACCEVTGHKISVAEKPAREGDPPRTGSRCGQGG